MNMIWILVLVFGASGVIQTPGTYVSQAACVEAALGHKAQAVGPDGTVHDIPPGLFTPLCIGVSK